LKVCGWVNIAWTYPKGRVKIKMNVEAWRLRQECFPRAGERLLGLRRELSTIIITFTISLSNNVNHNGPENKVQQSNESSLETELYKSDCLGLTMDCELRTLIG
jgi:hypothetical protein